MGNKKNKKQKTVYIDDGSTIADMSGLEKSKKSNHSDTGKQYSARPRASAREQWNTYVQSVKMMFLPMLVTIGIICVVFLILWFLM